MSVHLLYSRNGKAHDLILQESENITSSKNIITLNSRNYVVVGADEENDKEAEFLVAYIKELSLDKEVNIESLRASLIKVGVDENTLQCPLLETTQKVAKSAFPSLSKKSIPEQMEDILNKAVREEGFSGSVIVAQKGTSLLRQQDYGYASSLKSKESEITYRWASISKTVTAVAILQLAEKGVIDLDSPITKYFKEYSNAKKYPGFQGITARQLLSHQSLAPDHSDYIDKLVQEKISEIHDPIERERLENIERHYQEELANITDPIEKRRLEYPEELEKIQDGIKYFNIPQLPKEMVENIMTLPLKETPYAYNNFAFTLLALLVEKMASSYEQYVQENIFYKAGMKTTLIATHNDDHVVAEGYVLDESEQHAPAPLDDASVRFGSGNINGSVEDLYHFDRALHDGNKTLLQDPLLTEMNDQYLGWDNEAPPQIAGQRMVGKTGAFARGNLTSYQYFPDTDTTIIILAHSPWSMASKRHVAAIGEELAEVLFS